MTPLDELYKIDSNEDKNMKTTLLVVFSYIAFENILGYYLDPYKNQDAVIVGCPECAKT